MPTSDGLLSGINVLVTRPETQAENLAQQIQQLGGNAIRFPVIQIAAIEDNSKLLHLIDKLEEYDIAIFVSPNAVKNSAELIQHRRSWPTQLKIAAVGKSSAKALDSMGLIADIFPSVRFNSEALLELPAMQAVEGKKIIIFRGEGGRETLATTLELRGAHVQYAECYRRIKPNVNIAPLLEHWKNDEIDIVVTTSNEGLQNLYDMAGQAGRLYLVNSPLIVFSERAKILALQLGFVNQVIVLAQASDEAIVNAIVQWHKTVTSPH